MGNTGDWGMEIREWGNTNTNTGDWGMEKYKYRKLGNKWENEAHQLIGGNVTQNKETTYCV